MTTTAIIILSIYFVLNILLVIATAQRVGPQKTGENGISLFADLVITGSLVALILTQTLRYACVGIAVLAIYEVIQVALKQQKLNNKIFLLAFPPLLLMVYCFLWFADHLAAPLQLLIYTTVFIFDHVMRLSGRFGDRHPMAPHISPITWQGLALGLLLSAGAAFVLGHHMPVTSLLLLCGGSMVLALAGELYAAWCKYLLGVKTYSNLIPGHGGILDRFGSLMGATIFLYLLSYLLPISF